MPMYVPHSTHTGGVNCAVLPKVAWSIPLFPRTCSDLYQFSSRQLQHMVIYIFRLSLKSRITISAHMRYR